MKTLHILWQRLVTPEGETCERCGGTHDAIVQALPKLGSMPFPVEIDFSTNMICGGTTARH